MRPRRQFPAVLLAVAWLAGSGRADPAADMETQYQAAVAVLKKPPINGLLVIEVQPESTAAAAGMRGGDILTEYHGTRVATLQALSELVADAVARRLEGTAVGADLLVRVRRGDREVILTLPRDVLGIRAVEVRAGVPGPRNPPPNPRGTLVLDWKSVGQTLRADAGESSIPAAFRMFERIEPAAEEVPPGRAKPLPTEEWAGWELCTIKAEGDDALTGSIERHHVTDVPAPAATQPNPTTERSTFTFRLRLGDHQTLPAFVLEEMTARYPAPTGLESALVVVSAARRGETLQTALGTATDENAVPPAAGAGHDTPAPLSAIPQAALPWVAAALPQNQGDALGLYLLSNRELLPRPGYVLYTRGKQPMPADPTAIAAPPAWRVDLMLCGVVIESYWFTDQRRLLCVQTFGPQSIVARRVDNSRTAAAPLERQAAPPQPPRATVPP